MECMTHAGGIVFHIDGGEPRYLLVTARQNADHWVLPKGHVEEGESVEQAAVREVEEETGVTAEVTAPVGILAFDTLEESVRTQFFLMRFRDRGVAREGREQRWCSYDEALAVLTFEDTRDLLARAHRTVQEEFGDES